MEKGRIAEVLWPAERAGLGTVGHANPARQKASRKPAEYLRVVPLERLAGSKTETWLNEGRAAARAGFTNYSPTEYNYDSYHEASGNPPAHPAAHEPDKIIRPWSNLLEQALESEVFPRLLEAQRAGGVTANRAISRDGPTGAEIGSFVGFILAEAMTEARALAQAILQRGIGRTALLDDLFAPAARRLGELWEQDSCDFAAVTLGILRLDQMMHETETENAECHGLYGHDRRALLMPVPGDQHSFGIGVVADTFRGGGWHVWSGRAATRPELLRLVRRESFHLIGFSSTNQRLVGQLPSCIRAVRQASRNRHIRVMVGGKYFLDHPDQVAAVGADAMASDARDALNQANALISALAGADGHTSTQIST